VANTFVLLTSSGTMYLGTAKHSSVVKVLKLATDSIAHLFKRVNTRSEAASIPIADTHGVLESKNPRDAQRAEESGEDGLSCGLKKLCSR
jgi:hypothetical protein